MPGAPKTLTFSIHSPLHYDRMGLGLSVIHDNIGVQSKSHITGNYAYRIHLDKRILAFGLAAGISVYNTDWPQLVAADPDDPNIADYPESKILPNFSFGTWYKTERFYAGVSLPLFLGHSTDSTTGEMVLDNKQTAYTYFLTSGYTFGISENFKFLPSVLLKFNAKQSVQLDVTTQISYNDILWLGVTYRTRKSMVGMIQLQLSKQIRLAYAYGFDFGLFKGHQGISHEIMLRYDLVVFTEAVHPREF